MKETSGIDELQCIAVEVSDLASGYNKALKKAKNDIVVFLRKDVRICTQNWGRLVVDVFSRSSHGIIGTLGSLIVPKSGMIWEREEPICGRIWYEHYNNQNKNIFGEDFNDKVLDVLCLEGSFFVLHKDRIACEFDERYKGDSFFENDFCLENHKKGVKVGVFFGVDVLKENFDDQDDAFISNHKKFIKKQKDLPLRIVPELVADNIDLTLESSLSVQVIIPNKGQHKELITCLESIVKETAYDNYTVSVIDYGSTKEEVTAIQEYISDKENIELKETKQPQISSIYNEEAEASKADLLVFMSKHTQLKNDAISLMIDTYLKNPKECGTIGIRTHLKNNMVRQFGLELTSFDGEEGMELGLSLKGLGKSYAYRNELVKGVMGNSHECFLIERALFEKLGGFNTNYMHSLEDFELSLKSILEGRQNYLVGNAAAIYMSFDRPKFLPKDYFLLMDYINQNIELITPYVNLISA